MWPSNSDEVYSVATSGNRYFSQWTGGYVTKRYNLIWADVSNANSSHEMTYTASWSRDTASRNAYYWLQQPDGTYVICDHFTQIGLNTTGLNAKEIDGYTRHNGNGTRPNSSYPASGENDAGVYEYNFYYDRLKYSITYKNGNEILNTIDDIYYDADISGETYNYVPAAPAGKEDYIWGGWYADAALAQPYTFNLMPSNHLLLYAKWIAPDFTVSFVDEDGTTALAASQTVEKYHKAEKPTNPTKSGYTFDGWFTSADGTTLFDWNTQITADTVVYAHWTRNTLGYTVHYVDVDGNAVAQDKVVSNPNYVIGQEVTELAIAVAGYRPQTNSKTLELTGEDADNVITFVYIAKSDTTGYRVRYLIDPTEFSGDIAVAPEKTAENVPGDTASVVELAAAVNYAALYAAHPELTGLEFFPDEVEKTLVLAADESQNILTFYYSSFKSASVTINFVDMDGNPIADSDAQRLKVGRTFTLARTPIAGWEINKVVEGTSYNGVEADADYKITEATAASGLTFTIFYQKKLTITAVSISKQIASLTFCICFVSG